MAREHQSASAYPESVDRLIEQFATLPGIGQRSAERLAFHILKSSSPDAMKLSNAIAEVKKRVRNCSICFTLADDDPCPICANPKRDAETVLVVEQPRDLISLEQTSMYTGIYHVLLGRLAPLDNIGPDEITAAKLFQRVEQPDTNARSVPIKEIILGLNPDMEGDTTALYLAEQLAARKIKVSRLARGLPTGSQIEYANKAVLADAIQGRQSVE